MLGFLPVENAEEDLECVEDRVGMDVLQYELTSLEVVPFEKVISHTSSTSCRKKRITVLNEAMRSLLAPLTKCSETGFEVSLKDGKNRDAFRKYCLTVATFQRLKTCLPFDMERAGTTPA